MTSDERRVRTDWELEHWGVSTAGRLGAFLPADAVADASTAAHSDDAADDGADDANDANDAAAHSDDADDADDGNHIAHAQRWAWEAGA